MGLQQVSQSLVRRKGLDVRTHPVEDFSGAYHPCLGLGRRQPYSAAEGKLPMSWQAADLLKQQISLLDYLQGQGWKPARRSAGGKLLGLCPLHTDHRPSFLVDPCKNLFYCYGCNRGGDVIRLAELYHGVRFATAIALLRRWSGLGSPLPDVTAFYEMQLHRHADAVDYLLQRGLHRAELIEQLRIGYAPGRCLRAWLTSLGYPLESLQQAGLVNAEGHDAYSHRIVFPLEGNLYGRSTGAAFPHMFLPGSKGGLYAWERVRRYPEIILVEGMFDLAVLWQAGFDNVTCALGNHLNALQFRQLCTDDECQGRRRTVYLAFDADVNGSGQRAAQRLSQHLQAARITARRVELPNGRDPNSFFVSGGNAHEFHGLLERARL
jgi:DNA primase